MKKILSLFSVAGLALAGQADVVLDDKENYLVKSGETLYFNGNHFINADFAEETEVLISLIKE